MSMFGRFPCVVMSELTCQQAIHAYREVILGECGQVWRNEGGDGLLEVSDLVQEAHLRLLTRWPQITATAQNLRAYVRLEARRAAQRYLRYQSRTTFTPVDLQAYQ